MIMDILSNTTLSNLISKYKLFSIYNSNNFLIISTQNINPNVIICSNYLNDIYNKVKYFVYENNNNIYKLLFIVPKIIKNTNKYVENIINNNYGLSLMCKYSGSYIVLFSCNNIWYFSMNYQIYLLDKNIHPILYSSLKNVQSTLDNDLCYHLILNDTRLRKIILAKNNNNEELILLKKTYKYTMTENNNITNEFTNIIYYHVSCIDELYYKIIELDNKNKILKKLYYLGFIVKLPNDIYISFNTTLLNNLLEYLPHKNSPPISHLYLYQNNKLNIFLNMLNSFITNEDLIDRINTAFNTLSKEILDIYHLTRNKKNSNLYFSIPPSYKKLLYILHKEYISFNGKQDINLIFDNDKLSLNVSIVYKKLKEIDINLLCSLFIDRSKIMHYEIKNCSDTNIQCYLLK